MFGYIVGFAVLVGALAVAAAWKAGFLGSLGGAGSRDGPSSGTAGAAEEGTSPATGDAAALEHSRLAIHGLLQSISDSVEDLLGDSAKYGDSLDEHREAIRKAQAIAELRALERAMLIEVEKMRQSNTGYRDRLDEADDRIRYQQRELESLQADVGIDFLTKIPNRRSLVERLAEELDRAKRYETTFSLVMLDIDHFKVVNDAHGHLAGDRILRALAELLDGQRRSSDFLARFGGEEFVFILPETTGKQALVLAERVRKKVEKSKFRFGDVSITVTVSMGVSEAIPAEDAGDALFARVDAALYRAKKGGRNRVKGPLADG